MVGHIRDTLQMKECRIILRTGQPGYAPELSVFNEYDINDYRTKAELTRTRLITAITSALRSFEQIRTIAENRRGLEMIVHASADLMETRAITALAEGVLTQLAAILKLPLDGIVCAQRGSPCASDLTASTSSAPPGDWRAMSPSRCARSPTSPSCRPSRPVSPKVAMFSATTIPSFTCAAVIRKQLSI